MANLTISPLAPENGFPEIPEIDGVTFAAVEAGVKYQKRTDLMLAHCTPGSSVAGVFTRSATRSAPVLDCQDKLAAGLDQDAGVAIVVNSGNSNAFTGASGRASVDAIVGEVAGVMKLPTSRVFTASTGVIGEPLPADRITAKIADLNSGLGAGNIFDAAQAIMTTDTFPKGASGEVSVGGKTVKIAGIAKGSGMIAPDMATMLVYIFTDAEIAPEPLQAILSELNEMTFNCITVDSDTSTSDSLMLVASGASGVNVEGDKGFKTALHDVMRDLSHQVVCDGEGATKFITVNVSGAKSDSDARKVAGSIANSPLVKTAIAGEDPNWGRIVMAVGKSGAEADRDLLAISFGDVLVADKGWVSASYSEDAGAALMKNAKIDINVDLGLGAGKSTMWTCDLTHGYITINADYRS